jgi:hypothetical protein
MGTTPAASTNSAAGGAAPGAPGMPKLRGAVLADILARAALPAEATRLLAGAPDAPAAVAALRAAGELDAAARLMAFALPRREAVWWACMCAHAVPSPETPEADRKALERAMAWVYRPTDEARRAAFDHARAAAFGTPEAWAGVAAFWSGDSIAPAGQAAVPPAANLPGTAVAGAVALAAVRAKPERRLARLERFLDSAADIAGGGTGRMPPEAG